jgi:hypothetical protein
MRGRITTEYRGKLIETTPSPKPTAQQKSPEIMASAVLLVNPQFVVPAGNGFRRCPPSIH